MNRHDLAQINQVLLTCEKLLAEDLLGVYLYGSATLGTLRPTSDLDLLIISKHKITDAQRKSLTQEFLQISGAINNLSKRPLEITIVNPDDLNLIEPYCDYMYGEWLRDIIEKGQIPQPFIDPDLQVLLYQVQLSHLVLKGPSCTKFLPKIAFSQVQEAIFASLPSLIANFQGDERNVLLTLCRMWFTLNTQKITTKDVAAKWASDKVPAKFVPLLTAAKDAYLEGLDFKVTDEAPALVNFLKAQIENSRNH